jgi:outer membrane protein insertion porin family
LSESNRFRFGLDLRHIDFETGPNASQEVLDFEEAEGNQFLNLETSISWREDSRDSAIFPKRGATQSLIGEVTIPGSDLTYYKISYEQRRYWPLSDDLIFSVNGEISYGDAYGDTSQLPLWENYFGGGPGSIRGYAARSIGPRDSQGDPIGGNAAYTGNLELLFPPPYLEMAESVRLAAFFDFGSVIDTRQTDLFDPDELRYSTGIGASWLSPVGALTVSYAKPLKTDGQDEEEQFQFNLGRTF